MYNIRKKVNITNNLQIKTTVGLPFPCHEAIQFSHRCLMATQIAMTQQETVWKYTSRTLEMLHPVITLMGFCWKERMQHRRTPLENQDTQIPTHDQRVYNFILNYLNFHFISSFFPMAFNKELSSYERERQNERMRMNVYSFLLPLLGLSLFSTVNVDVLYHQRKHTKMLFLKVITEIQSLLPASLQDNDSKHCPR